MRSTEPICDDGDGSKMRSPRADTRTPNSPVVASSESTATPKDEFGLDPYTPTYGVDACAGASSVPQHFLVGGTLGSRARLESVVPWELRNAVDHASCNSFRFIATRHFWECVERAVRVAIVAMLPAAVMLHATFDDGNGPWVSQSFIISGALLASVNKETVGLQFAYIGQFFRAALLWVSIVTVETALHVYEYTAAWFIVYGVSVFCMATFMDGYARRLGMLLLTVATMNMLRFQVTDEVRPLRICLEWLVGAGFGFVGSLVPWPAFSSRKAEKAMHSLAKNISTSLQGLAASFWTDTNLTRNVRMVRVRFLLNAVEASIGKVKQHLEGAAYEWPFESARRRRLRALKVSLYIDLYRNLNSIRRVIEIVRDRPSILEHSERALLFGQRLEKKMGGICTTVDELLFHISCVQSRRALVATPLFDALAAIEADMQKAFHDSRREYFYESAIENLEEFVPLMTFYVFSMSQICATMMRMQDTVRRDLKQDATGGVAWRVYARDAFEYMMYPLVGTLETAKGVFVRRSPADKQRVIEAAKVSVAMVASLAFYFYTDESSAFLSGPTVIAFIASSNPSEAVVSAVPRLTGTLMGVVIGFFVGNTADTSVARVAGLITLAFVARLVAHVKTIGPALSYSTFIAISQVSVLPLSKDATMSRIQQSTFAVFIYVIITLFVFPVRPTALLRHARAQAVLSMAEVYKAIMEVFAETGDVYDSLQRAKRLGLPANNVASLPATSTPPGCGQRSTSINDVPMDVTITFGSSFAVNFLEFPKEKFEAIDRQLKAIDKLLLTAQGLMPFAIDEPRMTLVPYPSRACDDAQTALKKSVALLRTMAQSVRLLRERLILPSVEMIALFRNLVPCTRDSVVELRRFSMLVASLIEERRLTLGSELARSSQQFSHMCAMLHRRKSRVFLVCIKKAVTAARKEASNQPRAEDRKSEVDEPAPSPAVHHQRTSTLQLPSINSPTCAHRDDRFGQIVSMDDITAATYAIAQLDETVRPSSRHPSPTPSRHRTGGGHGAQSFASCPQPRSREDATAAGVAPGGFAGSVLHSRVPLPDSFEIPISTQDAEGVHALTFSVVLLSAELRKLVVAVEDTLQHHSQ